MEMKFWIMIALVFSIVRDASANSPSLIGVERACMADERWVIDDSSGSLRMQNWLSRFDDFIHQRQSPLYSFSQAILLKRLGFLVRDSGFGREFSEYWVSRILYELNFDPLAHQAFSSLLENSETPAIRKAALVCLSQIERRSPDWKIPEDAVKGGVLAPAQSEAEAQTAFFLALRSRESPVFEKLLPPGYRDLIRGIQQSVHHRYGDAIPELARFLEFLENHPRHFLGRYADDARILLGRSLYSVARFKEAADQLQKVKKSSNRQIEALSDLSWAYLLDRRFDDSIGISMQLRIGSLRNTFAPETLMVAAIALNELCLYPDSIRTMRSMIHDYGPSYQWLIEHQKPADWYTLALGTIKGQGKTSAASPPLVPAKISGEWLKSSSFLTRQMELNRLAEEPARIERLRRRGASEQETLSKNFIRDTDALLRDIRIARLKLRPGEKLSEEWTGKYRNLKKQLSNLAHFYQASRTWRVVTRNYERKIPGYRQALVRSTNADLQKKNQEMLALLRRVRENTDLVEIEIYNGASQDLIWRNAHPDFSRLSAQFEEMKKERRSSEVWNWGSFSASELENEELWEDELGALKADVSNQCDKKDRYMRLKTGIQLSGGKS